MPVVTEPIAPAIEQDLILNGLQTAMTNMTRLFVTPWNLEHGLLYFHPSW
jgi:hypothetical protein